MFNYLNVRAGERTVEPFGEAAVLSDVADHGAIASVAARTRCGSKGLRPL
jgi:hypothetical protein